jgi:hypothetical protein
MLEGTNTTIPTPVGKLMLGKSVVPLCCLGELWREAVAALGDVLHGDKNYANASYC